MWFLGIETLIGIAIICFAMIIVNRLKTVSADGRVDVLALLCLLFIGWQSHSLLAAYLLYILAIYVISHILLWAKHARRLLFGLGVISCMFPLFVVRLWPGRTILVIGLAFAVLRAIDAIFYVHYTNEKLHAKTLFNYMLFIPTFTAGPIFRYRDFAAATENLLPISATDFVEAIKRIIRGFFKIFVIGQMLASIFSTFTAEGATYTLPISILIVVCSYFMLFFDLSGYADIAIGVGRLCGFIVPENFKQPWRAASFTQFWRSWHSTVSDWIREHVYILLYNQNMNKLKAALVAFVVILVMMLWHGFAIRFVVVIGVYLGGLLALENLLGLTSPKRKWTAVRVFRCFAVNFLFGINTLLFFVDMRTVINIVLGLFQI